MYCNLTTYKVDLGMHLRSHDACLGQLFADAKRMMPPDGWTCVNDVVPDDDDVVDTGPVVVPDCGYIDEDRHCCREPCYAPWRVCISSRDAFWGVCKSWEKRAALVAAVLLVGVELPGSPADRLAACRSVAVSFGGGAVLDDDEARKLIRLYYDGSRV